MGSAVRPRRWAGPPPLLLLATLAAIVLAPLVSDNRDAPPIEPAAAETDAPGAVLAGHSLSVERPGRAPRVVPGGRVERRQVIGVASFNQWHELPLRELLHDARVVTGRPGVDVVGWQETERSGPVFAALDDRGWQTRRFRAGAGSLAVSWRRSLFALESASARKVAHGVDELTGRYPFGNRYIVRVTLRHRPTGRLLTVLNTHLPHKIEDLDRPGRWLRTSNAARSRFQLERMTREWRTAPGRWVVGTGDYNFDARADARLRLPRGPRAVLGELAVSSYADLGMRRLTSSHPPTGRLIDYVLASGPALRTGRLEFVDHRMIVGLSSDHHAVVARLELR